MSESKLLSREELMSCVGARKASVRATIAALANAWRAEWRARIMRQHSDTDPAYQRRAREHADDVSEKLIEKGWLDDDGGDDG